MRVHGHCVAFKAEWCWKCARKEIRVGPASLKVFLLVNHSWAWGLLWNVADVDPVLFHLENTDFPCLSSSQLQMTSWLGAGLWVCFSLSMLRFCLGWTCAGLVYADMISVSSCVHLFCCVWKVLFSWRRQLPMALKSCYSLFQKDPELWRKGFDIPF